MKRSMAAGVLGLTLILAACAAPASVPGLQPARTPDPALPVPDAPIPAVSVAKTPDPAVPVPDDLPTQAPQAPQAINTPAPAAPVPDDFPTKASTAAPVSAEELPILTAELTRTVTALLPPPPTPDGAGTIGPTYEGVSAFPLNVPGSSVQLWAAFTYGLRDFIGQHNHYIMIYARTGAGWQKIARYNLEAPDYIAPDSLQQVALEPSHIWLELHSGVGAHGGCYNLLGITLDGRAVEQSVADCADNPGAGETRDLNGDGQLEMVLNHTDSYVFCYACGLRYFRFAVRTWDGRRLAEQTLRSIPADASSETREHGNRAVQLAQAGLWKDALLAANAGQLFSSTEPVARWNAALIQLHADAFKQQVDAQIYPLLANVLYGDYEAALVEMQLLPPADLFKRDTSLIKGTVAEGWEDALSQWITTVTSPAIEARPDLAAAYFLRGWAASLIDPANSAVLPDLEKAAELKPDEALFTQSAAYLRQK